jgi:hypothetical protein
MSCLLSEALDHKFEITGVFLGPELGIDELHRHEKLAEWRDQASGVA